MPRFPCTSSAAKELGRLLAAASLDPNLRDRLTKDPKSVLGSIGLPEETLALFEFNVVAPKRGEDAVVIPYRYSQKKLDSRDSAYSDLIERTMVGGLMEKSKVN